MNNAFAAGQRQGFERDASAIDCPIDHASLLLRLSWMDGFSKGRCLLAEAESCIEISIWQ